MVCMNIHSDQMCCRGHFCGTIKGNRMKERIEQKRDTGYCTKEIRQRIQRETCGKRGYRHAV